MAAPHTVHRQRRDRRTRTPSWAQCGRGAGPPRGASRIAQIPGGRGWPPPATWGGDPCVPDRERSNQGPLRLPGRRLWRALAILAAAATLVVVPTGTAGRSLAVAGYLSLAAWIQFGTSSTSSASPRVDEGS